MIEKTKAELELENQNLRTALECYATKFVSYFEVRCDLCGALTKTAHLCKLSEGEKIIHKTNCLLYVAAAPASDDESKIKTYTIGSDGTLFLKA